MFSNIFLKNLFFHLVSSLSLFIFSFIFSLLFHLVSQFLNHLLSSLFSLLVSSLLSLFCSSLLFSCLVFHLLSSLCILVLSRLLLPCLVLSFFVFSSLVSPLPSSLLSSVPVFFPCFQHVRVVPVHTGTFGTYTRARCEWTHGGEGEGHRKLCLPKFAHIGLSRDPEVHQK